MLEFSNLDEWVSGVYETGAGRDGPIEWLWHPYVHGGEVSATLFYELMASHGPEEHRRETWWYYAQSGFGVFKRDLWFYSVDHDFRNRCEQIPGTVPIYCLTGRVRLGLPAGEDAEYSDQGEELGVHHLWRGEVKVSC